MWRLLGGGTCGSADVSFACCFDVLLIKVGLFSGIALTGVCCVAFVVLVGLDVLCSGGVRCFGFCVCFCVCDSVAELLFLLHWMQLDVLLLVMSVDIAVALIGESLPVDVLLLMPV